MSDPQAPIMVNASSLPAELATLARYLTTLVAGWLVSHGYIMGSDSESVIGLLMGALVAGWGWWATRRGQQKQQTMARALPDAVAQVKGE